MTRRNISASVLAIFALLVVLSQPAFALPTSELTYDPSTERINIGITGGEQDSVYTIHVLPQEGSCVDTIPPATLVLDGPDDTGSVGLECLEPDSTGEVAIQFCIGAPGSELCYETLYLNLGCRSDCSILEIGKVPALSEWGMLILVVLIIASAIWVIRKKRVTAH